MALLMVLIIFSVIGGELLIGSAVALLRVIGMVFDGFNNIMTIIYSINQNSLYMTKLIDFINRPRVGEDYARTNILCEIKDIELKDLNFSYPGSSKKILKNINLTINKGETIALFGKNGWKKYTH